MILRLFRLLNKYYIFTAAENIIGAPKMKNIFFVLYQNDNLMLFQLCDTPRITASQREDLQPPLQDSQRQAGASNMHR